MGGGTRGLLRSVACLTDRREWGLRGVWTGVFGGKDPLELWNKAGETGSRAVGLPGLSAV